MLKKITTVGARCLLTKRDLLSKYFFDKCIRIATAITFMYAQLLPVCAFPPALTLAASPIVLPIITYTVQPSPTLSTSQALTSQGGGAPYVSTASIGTLTYDPDANKFTYTAPAGFFGSQTATFTLTDAANQTASGSFILRINNTLPPFNVDNSLDELTTTDQLQNASNLTSTAGSTSAAFNTPIIYGNIGNTVSLVTIAGNITFNGTNTYTGNTNIRDETTLSISRASNIGAGNINMQEGATLTITKSMTSKNKIFIGVGMPR